MKIIVEMENVGDVQQAVATLIRAFPQAFTQQSGDIDAPQSGIVAPDGRPAAEAAAAPIVTPGGEAPKKRARPTKESGTTNNPATGPKLEDVRAAARGIKTEDGQPNLPRVREVLGQLGVGRIDEIPQARYAEAVELFNKAAQAGQA